MNGGYYHVGKWWQDENLWKAAEGRESVMMQVAELAMHDYGWNMSSMKDLSEEIKKVMAADYSYPIILDERGVICDGRHRVVHAYLDGMSEIPTVTLRDDEFPEPDYDEWEAVKKKVMTEWITGYESPHDIGNKWGYDYEGRSLLHDRWKDLGFIVNDAYVPSVYSPTILVPENKEDDVIVVNESKKLVWFQGLRKLLPSKESVVGFLLKIGLLEKKE